MCIYLVFFLKTITLSTFHLGDVLKEVRHTNSRLKLAGLELTYRQHFKRERDRKKYIIRKVHQICKKTSVWTDEWVDLYNQLLR